MTLWPTRRQWHGRETFCSDGILQGKLLADEARKPEKLKHAVRVFQGRNDGRALEAKDLLHPFIWA
ncbi:hypothetical protein NBRC116589_13830 [Ruegeria sp. HU-ET01832]